MKRKAGYHSDFASLARSAEKKLTRFEERETPTERPKEQDVRIRSSGGRTGKMALRLTGFRIPGLLDPFDAEVSFGERIGVIGPNGTGKTHFLRLLAGEDVAHEGEWRLGVRVEPGLFRQLHDRADLKGVPIVEVLQKRGMSVSEAMAMLNRYELSHVGRDAFELLSGGQQARFQLLLMEVESPTMLLLDEPTDNLDVASAEALEDALLRMRARSSRSRTTAGSCASWTGSSGSTRPARSASSSSRPGPTSSAPTTACPRPRRR